GRCGAARPVGAARASPRRCGPSRWRRGRGRCRSSRLQDHRGGLAAGGAHGDEATGGLTRLRLLLREELGQGADDPSAGGAEGVSRGEGGAGDVEPVGVHGAQRLAAESLAAELGDRKSTRLNSSHVKISYAVFCLKKKKKKQ